MARLESVPVALGRVRIAFTDRSDGDFQVDQPSEVLGRRRRAVIDHPWTWLRQVHGNRVLAVTEPGQGAGEEADGAFTSSPWCPLAIMTADCAPVVLVADTAFAIVHAGWRGLVDGVIDNAAAELARLGASPVATRVGPCIAPEAYEFGADDLAVAVDRLGEQVRATTAWGTPALDVPAAVAIACDRAGWPEPVGPPACTSAEQWFSHRTRTDPQRQATVAWMEPVEELDVPR